MVIKVLELILPLITIIKLQFWREIVAKIRSAKLAMVKGDLRIEGGISDFGEFMGMFSEE